MTSPTDSSDPHARDLELVRSVLAGDARARKGLAERLQCVPRFLGSMNRRLGRPLDSETLADISQETLFVIWRKLETFEGRATLDSWSWRFCQHELSNAMRKQTRHRHTSSPEELEQAAVEPATPELEYDYLERGLEALGGEAEDVIRLKHFEHLKFHEIAERLDIPINTAKTRYYRGMTWLKGYLESREEQQ